MSILNAKGREKNNIHIVCNISVEFAKTSCYCFNLIF
jgi:hypothetical protein